MREEIEAEIVAGCRRGDARAWDDLFDEHYTPTYRFVFQLGFELTHEDVEEICQEAFLAVVKNLTAFKGGSRFQTWLFRIAANKAKDYRERMGAAKRGGGRRPISLEEEHPRTGQTLEIADNASGPDAALLADERLTSLQQALDDLGGDCQEIIQLRYFGDLSYDEIGRTLALNPKTVSSRLSRCLDRLEAIIKGRPEMENLSRSSV